MKSLWDIIKAGNTSSLAVCGLAKNVGKTVALNYLLAQAAEEQLRIGLTSIGRDGEQWDALNHRRKPLIRPAPGTLIATAEKAMAAATARLSILMKTDIRTPLGNIVIARIEDTGRVELAGPSTLQPLREVLALLKAAGAEKILVDGALDRQSFAAPAVTGACILATGAILGNTQEKTAEITGARVQQLMIPQADPHYLEHYRRNNVTILTDIAALTEPTVQMFSSGKAFWQQRKAISTIVFGGALTQSTLEDIMSSGIELQGLKLIVKDATCLFINQFGLRQFAKAGGQILTIERLKLLAVTLNPTSPEGQNWDAVEFYRKMAKAVPEEVPVFDIVAGLGPD